MSLRAFFRLGAAYLRNFVKLRDVVTRIPKGFQLPKVHITPPSFTQSRLDKLFGNFRRSESFVRLIQRTLSAAFTNQRPVNLSRAYNAVAGSVHLRHQLDFHTNFPFAAINEAARLREASWFERFMSSLKRYRNLPILRGQASNLSPKELLGVGCNSAVWAAELTEEDNASNAETEGVNTEVAVKVLYNFYASRDLESASVAMEHSPEQLQVSNEIEDSVDWVLLHRQLERECEMRPSSGHPNIVPLVGHFRDRAPASGSSDETSNSGRQNSSITAISNSDRATCTMESEPTTVSKGSSGWVGAEAFPEGFGGRPFTYYLIMPRFEATLDDLFHGVWSPPGLSAPNSPSAQQKSPSASGCTSHGGTNSNSGSVSFVTQTDKSGTGSLTTSPVSLPSPPVTTGQPSSIHRNSSQRLGLDEAVGILAQLFDAVAELEAHGIAHRDIKPNNILLRRRLPLGSTRRTLESLKKPGNTGTATAEQIQWLNDAELLATNTRVHAAITDFGCAIRTTRKSMSSERFSSKLQRFFDQVFSLRTLDPDPALLAHSGNFAFLAPEISVCLSKSTAGEDQLLSSIYAKADLWAVATLAYPLFGRTNPFTDGTLESATYTEADLPSFPSDVPGVITWMVSQCLTRIPSLRPSADFVADVLHTWCLLRHVHRRARCYRLRPHSSSNSADCPIAPSSEDNNASLSREDFVRNVACTDRTGQEILNALSDSTDVLSDSVITQLRLFLDVCWAADWLTGPARPPDGLRVAFYRRVTLGRLAACLRTVHASDLNCSVALFSDVPSSAKVSLVGTNR